MIDLTTVKYVLFDFDGTLCAHSEYKGHDHKDVYIADVLVHEPTAYSDGTPNRHLKLLMDACAVKDIPMGLLSATCSFVTMQAKHDWVYANYQYDLENLCVGTGTLKVDMLKALTKAYNLNPSEILLVDDCPSVQKDAAHYGFSVCSPIEAVNYVEKNILSW